MNRPLSARTGHTPPRAKPSWRRNIGWLSVHRRDDSSLSLGVMNNAETHKGFGKSERDLMTR
jgi:hypothetical protein